MGRPPHIFYLHDLLMKICLDSTASIFIVRNILKVLEQHSTYVTMACGQMILDTRLLGFKFKCHLRL